MSLSLILPRVFLFRKLHSMPGAVHIKMHERALLGYMKALACLLGRALSLRLVFPRRALPVYIRHIADPWENHLLL